MNLQLYILSALRDVKPFKMTDEAVLNEVKLAKPGGAELVDVQGELTELAQQGQVKRSVDPDKGAQFEIGKAGMDRLQRNNL